MMRLAITGAVIGWLAFSGVDGPEANPGGQKPPQATPEAGNWIARSKAKVVRPKRVKHKMVKTKINPPPKVVKPK